METHISYVLLTGAYAYKIKKAVNLQFLDFSTLAARRHDCHEELRLNRPLAPSVYLDVVAITGTVDAPAIGGDGPVLEYALKMRQFRQDGLFSDMLARGVLTDAHIDQLATVVASFHQSTNRAGADAPYGRLHDILQPALENFTQLLAVVDEPRDRSDLEYLRTWTGGEHTSVRGQVSAPPPPWIRSRMPRRPPSRQHRADRRPRHAVRPPRVQRLDALD